MANHAATAGLVKIGSDTIGELRSYSLSQSVGTIEDRLMQGKQQSLLVLLSC